MLFDHKRTIAIDDDLIAVLVAEGEKYQRIVAGIPDRAGEVDLSLAKLRTHDLRGGHETALLDAGVHIVAARCDHDPAVLLRICARRDPQGGHVCGRRHCGLVEGVLAG